ncbi:MAG TPA: amino acid racemase [Candidatus Gracilibacteria bacterium]
MKTKTIGILGGMGPQASLEFYRRLIDLSIERCGADSNKSFPHMLLSNLPVPDWISDTTYQREAVDMAVEELKILEKAGADFTVLTCNTMHLFTDEYRAALKIPFLSMIDCVVEAVQVQGITKVGLLGSASLLRSTLYQNPLAEQGISTLIPQEEAFESIAQVTKRIIAGTFSLEDKSYLLDQIERLKGKGAQGLILGCTELPLVLSSQDIDIALFSSLHILAERACEALYA